MDKTLNLIGEPLLMWEEKLRSMIQSQRVLRPNVQVKDPVKHVAIDDKVMALAIGAGYTITQQGVALVPIIGPIFKGEGAWGYADQNELQGHVRNAVNDPNVSAIMFLIDSPGGSVAGTMDLADEIRAASKVKPTAAYAQDLMASAAMWIGTACDEIHCNASALIGSIGVITAFADFTKALETEGIDVHVITTGAFKAAGSPYVKATPEHLAYIQSRIDAVGEQFFEAVAKGRGMRAETVKKMEAKVFTAADAIENKLVDGIMTFDAAFSALAKRAKKSSGAAARTRAIQIASMQ